MKIRKNILFALLFMLSTLFSSCNSISGDKDVNKLEHTIVKQYVNETIVDNSHDSINYFNEIILVEDIGDLSLCNPQDHPSFDLDETIFTTHNVVYVKVYFYDYNIQYGDGVILEGMYQNKEFVFAKISIDSKSNEVQDNYDGKVYALEYFIKIPKVDHHYEGDTPNSALYFIDIDYR